MNPADEAISRQPDGSWRVRLRVQPKASADRIVGPHNGMCKVAVTAPPEKGKANDAVCRLIAKALGIATSDVTLLAGDTSREKTIGLPDTLAHAEIATALHLPLSDPPPAG